jgi:hypothetical protein
MNNLFEITLLALLVAFMALPLLMNLFGDWFRGSEDGDETKTLSDH